LLKDEVDGKEVPKKTEAAATQKSLPTKKTEAPATQESLPTKTEASTKAAKG
jgi:hypothetical protein